jgi:hypothetical protein
MTAPIDTAIQDTEQPKDQITELNLCFSLLVLSSYQQSGAA